jgi:hypothetical protein
MLPDLDQVQHHPALEEIVDVLCTKTQNMDRGFFRAEVAYFLGKMASSMRAVVVTRDRGEVPVNIYSLALATSGYGKGHSINIVEDEFLAGFKRRFTEDTFQVLSEAKLWEIANERAARHSSNQDEEHEKLKGEFKRLGSFPFTFDSGTTPAVKQLRQKLLMANCGSINMQIDEIGSNLIKETEVLTVFLELYDQGKVKLKLTKNTNDNQRGDELDGKTPTNMLLFGTPSKLLDGSQTEEQFYSFLETGYARRCLFGYGQHQRASKQLSPEEVFARLTRPDNAAAVSRWANHFHSLADPAMFGWKMTLEDDVAIELLRYKIACEHAAEELAEHEDIRKAEISHRYFKALKLAGAYAFVDKSTEVELDHLRAAIKLVEESGTAFQTILNREKSYVKLAKYIAAVGTEVTHADLHEALPFYKSGQAQRNEMMTLAAAWGYKKHIIIKKTFVDGIEFFQGETLKESNLNEISVSYSNHWAYNYLEEKVPFDQLHVLTQAPGMHWTNHRFKGGALGQGHRAEENVVAGFNLVVLDVDGGVSLATVHELLKDYKFLTYTTKRHTEQENRFRLILPINYHLELDAAEYKEFMNSVMAWLPFKTDDGANQRARKWESCDKGTHHYNDGELLDALDFIPKTSRNESYRQATQQLGSLDNLERWFAQRMAAGNRNNQMIRYALTLVDSGMVLIDVRRQVHAFNAKLSEPLSEQELDSTVLVTAAKRCNQRQNQGGKP